MAKRRPKGEGSITVLPSGSFRVRIETIPTNGHRRWLTATAATKSEALDKLRELTRQSQDIQFAAKETKDTLKTSFDSYLTAKETMGCGVSSMRLYRSQAKMVMDTIGTLLSINKITTDTVNEAVRIWRQEKQKEATIRLKLRLLSEMLDYMVFKGNLKTNPISYMLKMSKKSHKAEKSNKVKVISQELHETLKTLTKQRFLYRHTMCAYFYAVYCLAYETGMRKGEIASLKWDDIDLNENTVSVSKTRITDGKNYFDTTPKTSSGYRTIMFSENLGSILRQLKDYRGHNYTYVFSNKNDKPFTLQSYVVAFNHYMKLAGCDNLGLTFHCIRHTNASLMIAKGVPIPVVTERLGHSSINITYSTYVHIIDNKDRQKAVIEL